MSDRTLYRELEVLCRHKSISIESFPCGIESNLTSRYYLRDYQRKAICYLSYYDSEYKNRSRPSHLLFQMATGSGKTLVMAAAMLYFYTRGYRRFLFCSNREVIIEKTRDNLLNSSSPKYLFQKAVMLINGARVELQEVSTFSKSSNEQNIEVILSTVQKLHLNLKVPKENSLSEEELSSEKMIILADEAHHLQATSKSKNQKITQEGEAWENTIKQILYANNKNYLLELTATMDLKHLGLKEKYNNKLLLHYPLKSYRKEGYSKEIYCIASGASPRLQMLQALLLSQYRRELLSTHEGTYIKPVVLFKSAKIGTPKSKSKLFTEHQGHQEEDCYYAEGAYHYFTEIFLPSLIPQDFKELRICWKRDATQKDLEVRQPLWSVLEKALTYFEVQSDGTEALIETIRREFAKENCRLVHSRKKDKDISLELNNLEAEGNPIRAIFAVDMLNEGWDVLNLFDIVRLYSTKKDKKTTQEAQLIGRGARYCPFTLQEDTDDKEVRYKRKFDNDIENPLRVCESLYYHCQGDSAFVRELNDTLVKEGLKEKKKQVQLKLKDIFKKSSLPKERNILLNGQKSCHVDIPKALEKEIYSYYLGPVQVEARHLSTEVTSSSISSKHTNIKAKALGYAVLRTAVQRTEGFTYSYLLEKYSEPPNSMRAYIEEVLFPLRIKIEGRSRQEVNALTQQEKLKIASHFVRTAKNVIDKKAQQMKGTSFSELKNIKEVFKDKEIVSSQEATRYSGAEYDYHAYEHLYLTQEEQYCLNFLHNNIEQLNKKYEEIYIVRNERFFKIYNFEDGRAFEPDFVLFAKEEGKELLVVQCFIEPKGDHIQDSEQWKEDFLEAIEKHGNVQQFLFEWGKIRLVGLPFYNQSQESDFEKAFKKAFYKTSDDE